ncbi:MAG TPA: LapA family protein [Gemmatimonadaceae bacterium]|nr:LapA family protein [Gemmatimonadaceae bacterium]
MSAHAAVLSSSAMRYVLLILKLALFALALTFAVKNTDAVAVRYFLGYEWHTPLIFVLLVAFCFGAVLGLLGALGQILRQRREISALRRELEAQAVPAVVPDVAVAKRA